MEVLEVAKDRLHNQEILEDLEAEVDILMEPVEQVVEILVDPMVALPHQMVGVMMGQLEQVVIREVVEVVELVPLVGHMVLIKEVLVAPDFNIQ